MVDYSNTKSRKPLLMICKKVTLIINTVYRDDLVGSFSTVLRGRVPFSVTSPDSGNEPVISKAEIPFCAQNQVIEDGYLHDLTDGSEPFRKLLVGFGGLQLPRRMVMCENQPAGIGFEGILEHLLRVNDRSGLPPGGDVRMADDPVGPGQMHNEELLVVVQAIEDIQQVLMGHGRGGNLWLIPERNPSGPCCLDFGNAIDKRRLLFHKL
jgi:hypothetical protein